MKIDTKFFKSGTAIKTNAKLLGNVQEYLDVTEYLRETFDVEKPWYRGVSHSKYDLIPKVYRDRLWQRHENFEGWLFVDFTNRARPFVSDHHYSLWNWYFTMQHYGLPTRLLDWTEGSLTALYFAVGDPENTYTPSVYFMNPYWFDEFVYKKDEGEGMVYNTDDSVISEEHRSRLLSYIGEGEEPPKSPLCIEPPSIDCRIQAQKSVFTIHGKLINPFRILARDNDKAQIVKIRFATKKAKYMKQQLYGMGITEGTLFPDIEGLARDIKYERGID